jgi:3-oxoacyl-[acyl-carrier-protein] synthase-3
MENRHICLTGIGHEHGQNIITNQFFSDLSIGSDADWILDRTGIRSRSSVLSEETIREIRLGKTNHRELFQSRMVLPISEFAVTPWRIAAERATPFCDVSSVDAVICGTSVPDFDIPANACTIAAKLGFTSPSFDVNSACSSFVVGLHVARGLIRSGQANKIALFNVERYSTKMDYQDRTSSILFGDGAAASILEGRESASGLELIDTVVHSDPSGYDAVTIPEGGLFSQHGHTVQKFAIGKTCAVAEEILAKNAVTIADVDFFVGHQANLRMLTAATQRLGIPESRHLFNVDRCGNQGAAGAPCVISENWERFRSGQLLLIAVVGAGLTWGAALFRVWK